MTRFAKQKCFCGGALVAIALALPAAAGGAFAEDGQTPPGAAAPVQPAPQPPPASRPGFLHQLKVWWDDSVAVFDAKSKDTQGSAVGDLNKKSDDATKSPTDAAKDAAKGAATATQDAMKNAVEATKGAATTATDAMKGAVEATKNAASAIVRLPNTRIVDVHETCTKAPNGAPDCAVAAVNGCRGKGFSTGSPLDVRTAQTCDTKPSQAGQLPGQVQCGTEAVVIRAVCQ